MMNGKGTFTFKDGRQYVGEYKDNQKDGIGTFKWTDGKEYYGPWKNGKQHGRGILIKKGIGREGQWENGVNIKWYD